MSSPAFTGRFLLPGPVEVHPDVLAAMTRPIMSHRGPAMASMLAGMQPTLQRLFGTARPVLIATCSATGLLEGAIRAGVEQRVLVAVGGYFGERLAQIAERCGKEVVRVMVPEGRTIEPSHLARFLEGPEVDAVALVHSETSTGALAPLAELAAEVRRHQDVLLLVDAVSSLGAVPIQADAWGIDFVGTGSQKALALPPGLALGVASERMMKRSGRMPGSGWYMDLALLDQAAREGLPTQTPAISLLYALDVQLRRISTEGLESRWDRHATMARMMAEWAEATDAFRLLAPPGRRSAAVSALEAREPVAPLITRLAERGWTVAPGLPPFDERIIRIGHMGDVQPGHVTALLEALAETATA